MLYRCELLRFGIDHHQHRARLDLGLEVAADRVTHRCACKRAAESAHRTHHAHGDQHAVQRRTPHHHDHDSEYQPDAGAHQNPTHGGPDEIAVSHLAAVADAPHLVVLPRYDIDIALWNATSERGVLCPVGLLDAAGPEYAAMLHRHV